MTFFELFSGQARNSIEVSARFPDQDRAGKPWLNLIRGEFEGVALPVRFEVVYGSTYTDLIATRNSGLFLISDRIVQILSEEQLTGWSHFPIDLIDAADRPVTGFSGLSILGRSGPIDLTKSEIVYKSIVPGAPVAKYFKGKFIDIQEWDGSDFFLPAGYHGTFLSEKAATVLTQSDLSNLHIRNLADAEVPEFTARMLEKHKRV